jgi:hypothetical protein
MRRHAWTPSVALIRRRLLCGARLARRAACAPADKELARRAASSAHAAAARDVRNLTLHVRGDAEAGRAGRAGPGRAWRK